MLICAGFENVNLSDSASEAVRQIEVTVPKPQQPRLRKIATRLCPCRLTPRSFNRTDPRIVAMTKLDKSRLDMRLGSIGWAQREWNCMRACHFSLHLARTIRPCSDLEMVITAIMGRLPKTRGDKVSAGARNCTEVSLQSGLHMQLLTHFP